MKAKSLFFVLLLLSLGTSVSTVAKEIDQNIMVDDFNPFGFYTFRRDLRKCVSPLCGGIFVKAVNRKQTHCPDGKMQEECYIASINNKLAIDLANATFLKGRIKAKTYPGFGNLGIFVLASAYRPATTQTDGGLFVGLENNRIVCITTPCFSVDQYRLNSHKINEISGIDLKTGEASDEIVEQGLAIMADGGILLASGYNQQVQENHGIGLVFIADQFYLPIK